MIQDLDCGLDPEEASGLASDWLDALRRLPQPLHLLEFVGRSQHYHFGCFERADEPLRVTQDRLSLRAARHLRAESSVLDIGCGLGGTSRLLARAGLSVTAIDCCAESVAYARGRGRALGTRDPIRYEAQALQAFSRASPSAYDGAVAIEILQHFPELGEFFGCCRRLLRPGGTLVLHDVSINVEIEWTRVPFHRRGRVLAAAEASGFRLLEQQDLTSEILPTLPGMTRELEGHRAELLAAFGGRHGRPVERELDQLLFHVRALQRAFEGGQLSHETTVLSVAPQKR